jgi:hypothetical protein
MIYIEALSIYNVMEVLDNMNKHPLKSLNLPYNGWESIPNDMFNLFECHYVVKRQIKKSIFWNMTEICIFNRDDSYILWKSRYICEVFSGTNSCLGFA